ncbi:hypothetical protein [Aeoliella mucimassa]|uniref:Uncharacterized protein n=1 Tax=Aeoliella mucimassa TaxID=2527972 RepID=A0A518ALW1_9BACT|nr:hypothetical protein [Aeoliella mucimassa]QDU55696.1 hypothetical protein Pan181_18900 [Aeoliella mucimassa]
MTAVLTPSNPTAGHIRTGHPSVIARGDQQAALRNLRLPEIDSLPDDSKERVDAFNEQNHDAWHKDVESLKTTLTEIAGDPETMGFADVWAARDIAGQQALELYQRRVAIMRARAELARELLPILDSVAKKRTEALPKVLKAVGVKLEKAGAGLDQTQAGRMGNYQEAAERQFAYQCRQHQDYIAADQLAKHASTELQQLQRFTRCADESIDIAVEALHQFCGRLLVGVSVDL